MNFSASSVFTKLALAASVATALVSCDDPEYPTPVPATGASTAQGRVLIVNAAPGSGDAQLRGIDNSPLATPPAAVPYLAASAYTNVPAGNRLLSFTTPTNLNNNQIYTRAAFNTNTSSTVFLTDLPTRPASGSDQGGVRAVVLADNLTAPASGRAKIRFVNLATSGTYGIYNTATSAALFSSAPVRASRATTATVGTSTVRFENFTEVNAGTYPLEVRVQTGTAPNTTISTVVGTQQAVTFAAGKIYTLYVRGVANNTATPIGISVVQHN